MIATAPRSPIRPSRSMSSITYPFHVSMPPARRIVSSSAAPHSRRRGDPVGAPARHPPSRRIRRPNRSPLSSNSVGAPPLPPPAKPPSSLGFLSCLACLYVAGRLWQDFESRILLSVLHCTSDQRPKVLMVEDKLMNLGCKEIGRKIVEAEIDLLLAKNQAYMRKKGDGSEAALLPVVGIYTGFGSRLKRNTSRGSWMPRVQELPRPPNGIELGGCTNHRHPEAWPSMEALPDGPVRRLNQAQVHVLPETVPRWHHPSNKGASCMTQGQCLLLSQGAPITRYPQRSRLQCNRAWIALLSASRRSRSWPRRLGSGTLLTLRSICQGCLPRNEAFLGRPPSFDSIKIGAVPNSPSFNPPRSPLLCTV